MNFSKLTRIGLVLLLVLQIAVLTSCEQYRELTNDPPKITTFTVPAEVAYGETVKLSVRVFDPEDDTLTYVWDVSDGTLIGDTGPEVQWTAPELPPEEIVPPKVVTIHVSVRDSGEEAVSKTASIIVFSKSYKVAQALSGTYTLVSKRVHGDSVEVAGMLRLTTTTFTRESQDILEGEIQGQTQFVSGSYKLIKPFDERSGTIHWFMHGARTPSISTYTWDGRLLVLFLPATSMQYVYRRVGADPGGFETDDVTIQDGGDVGPEPINTDPEPIEVVEEDVDPEPIDVDNEPVEALEEVVDPEPINAGGKPVEITDATFKTKVLNAALPVVLEFEADWCPFCRQMKPIVESVALEHRKTFIIGKLDIDENLQTTEKYKVKGIPTYVVFRNGAEVGRFVGAMPKEHFIQQILKALK
jgi:thioredoxin 1